MEVTGEREKDINRAMANLESEVNLLTEAMGAMEKEAEILRRPDPNDGVEFLAPPIQGETVAPLAFALNGVASRIYGVRQRLSYLVSTLEI